MKKWIAVTALALAASILTAQDFNAYRVLKFDDGGFILPYRLLEPVAPAAKYPLLIFLHGAFEKGNDNLSQLNIGGRFFLRDSIRKKYPAFVLFPQCPATDTWAYFENRINYSTGYASDWLFPFKKNPTTVTQSLLHLLESMLPNDSIDKSRVYIVGISQGGMGVLDIIARYPDRFAAALSMCGAGNASTARLFAGKVALWLFHGDKDLEVPADFSRQYFDRLKRLRANVRYSEYKNVAHNCWENAFAEPGLLSWLFSQAKSLEKSTDQNP